MVVVVICGHVGRHGCWGMMWWWLGGMWVVMRMFGIFIAVDRRRVAITRGVSLDFLGLVKAKSEV